LPTAVQKLLDTEPSSSGGGEKKFLPMLTQSGNARTTAGTPECLTAVYPTIETVGGNLIRLIISLAVNTGEGNLV